MFTLYHQNLSLGTLLTAANGKKMKALDVFSHSMWYLKEQAVRVIKTRTSDAGFTVNDIQWILTVPAIWSDAAKQFMREAAYKVSCLRNCIPIRSKYAVTILQPGTETEFLIIDFSVYSRALCYIYNGNVFLECII